MQWTVTTETWLNEDTGVQELRLTHNLIADILATDVVQFEIAFIPMSQWLSGTNIVGSPIGIDNSSATNLGEDGGRCSLAINTSNNKFWQATLSDVWYKCDLPSVTPKWGVTASPNKCAVTTNTFGGNNANIESSSTNDWDAPITDIDPENPWCTQANSLSTYSPYQCSAIKCIMSRPLDTEDDVYDY